MQRSQRKFYNYPLVGVSFYFVPFTRRLRVPRMHILLWTNKHYVACADLHREKKNRKVQIYNRNCFAFIHSCLFWWRSHYMFLDSEPEEIFQLPRSGMPLKEKKRTATLLPATEKIYMFLSSSPSVTKGKPFLFYSVKGSVRCHSHKPICFLYVNLRMRHNSYFAISLYACVSRSATA